MLAFYKTIYKYFTRRKKLIIGSLGKGKTTLSKSLLGFKQIKNGKIHIKNMLLTEETILKIRDEYFILFYSKIKFIGLLLDLGLQY